MQSQVNQFHKKCKVHTLDTPTVVDPALLLLRSRLIIEETGEFVSAATHGDLIGMIDALCDILFVTFGAADVMGIDIEPFFNEVCRSNMSKSASSDASGKIVKGANYSPPFFEPILDCMRKGIPIKINNPRLKCDNVGRPQWDYYFMSLCFLVAQRSLDVHTKHGCVVVSSDKTILSVGYNGPPRSSKDDVVPVSRPEKYAWMAHSESNAIANAARTGIRLLDSTFYVTGFPCETCALSMINAGAKKIVYGPVNSACVTESTKSVVEVMLQRSCVEIQQLDNVDCVSGVIQQALNHAEGQGYAEKKCSDSY